MAEAKYPLEFAGGRPLRLVLSEALGLDPPLSEGDWNWVSRVVGQSSEQHARGLDMLKQRAKGKSPAEAAAFYGLTADHAQRVQRDFLTEVAYKIGWYRKQHGVNFRQLIAPAGRHRAKAPTGRGGQ